MSSVRKKAVWGAALAIWLLLPATGAADGGRQRHGKVDRLLSENASTGPRRVIVRTRRGAKGFVRTRLQSSGAAVYGDHASIEALAVTLQATDIAALAADPDVESISTDAPVRASQLPTQVPAEGDPLRVSSSELKKALGIGDALAGSSITVAVIDSGLAPGADFDGRIVGFYDFTNGKSGRAGAAFDDYGHGTHVAGLIGSAGKSAKKYAGVAPSARFLALKALDANGGGYTSDVIRAIEFAILNKDRFNIRVINLSLGHPIYESAATDPLVQAVEHAVREGVIVVAAAGNYGINPVTGQVGYAGIASPGNAPSAITVGAANTLNTVKRRDDRVSPFSSRGPSWYDGIAKPDVVAPGDGLVSNLAEGSRLASQSSLVVLENTKKYLRLRGSSMATGVVSGLVALMLEANEYAAQNRGSWHAPRLSPNAVKAMLQYSATPLRDANGRRYDVLTQGSGLVNGVGAVWLAYIANTSRRAGAFWLTADAPSWTRFGGLDEVWSQKLVWGTRTLRGDSLIDVNQSAWAANIVWGTGELDNIVWGTVNEADNIVWGTALTLSNLTWAGNVSFEDNIVWGTADWADNIVWGTGLVGFFDGDNIVWGTRHDDNIVWGTLSDDNIVWGTNLGGGL